MSKITLEYKPQETEILSSATFHYVKFCKAMITGFSGREDEYLIRRSIAAVLNEKFNKHLAIRNLPKKHRITLELHEAKVLTFALNISENQCINLHAKNRIQMWLNQLHEALMNKTTTPEADY